MALKVDFPVYDIVCFFLFYVLIPVLLYRLKIPITQSRFYRPAESTRNIPLGTIR